MNKSQGDRLIKLFNKAVENGLHKNRSAFAAIVRTFKDYKSLDEDKFLEGLRASSEFGCELSRDPYIRLFKKHCI